MREVASFLIFLILLSSVSFSATTPAVSSAPTNNKATPSDVLSWAIALKDGSWTVKALGLATGKEGAEALSWVVDPKGNFIGEGVKSLPKEYQDLVQLGQAAMSPGSFVTNTAMQGAAKSNKDTAALIQAFTMQQQVQQILSTSPVPAKSAEFVYEPNKDKDGKENPKITQMTTTNIGKLTDSLKFDEFTKALGALKIDNANVAVTEETLVLKPYFPSGNANIESRAKFNFESKDKQNKIEGVLQRGSRVEIDQKKDSKTKDMVKNANIIAGEGGVRAQINGNSLLDFPVGSEIKIESSSCTDHIPGKALATTKPKACTTSAEISVSQRIVEAAPQKPGMLIDDTKKDPVKVSFCDKDYNVLPGSKVGVEMKSQGGFKDCYVTDGKLLWSNKIDNQNQVFKLANGVEITADAAKWDHQEGFLDIKTDKDGNTLVEGTMKNIKLKDGTTFTQEDQTSRSTMRMDAVNMSLSPNGDLLSMEVRSKNRDVTVSYGGVTLDKLRSGDTPFWKDVNPVELTPQKDGSLVVRTTNKNYKLEPKVKPASKAVFIVDESVDTTVTPDFVLTKPISIFNPNHFTTSSDIKIATDSFINDFYPHASNLRYNPPVCDYSNFYCQISTLPDSSTAGKEQAQVEDANKIKVNKDDTRWAVALDYELSRILSLTNQDKNEIKEAYKEGYANVKNFVPNSFQKYDNLLLEKLGSKSSIQGFNEETWRYYVRMNRKYTEWEEGMEIDTSVFAEPDLKTKVTSSSGPGQVVVQATDNAGRPVPKPSDKLIEDASKPKPISPAITNSLLPTTVSSAPTPAKTTPSTKTSETISPEGVIVKQPGYLPNDMIAVVEKTVFGISWGSYYEYQNVNHDYDSYSTHIPRVYLESMDNGRDSISNTYEVIKPILNPGTVLPKVQNNDPIFVYRKELDSRGNYVLNEYTTVSKTVWQNNKGFEGVLIDNSGKVFAIKENDVIRSTKAISNEKFKMRKKLGIQ